MPLPGQCEPTNRLASVLSCRHAYVFRAGCGGCCRERVRACRTPPRRSPSYPRSTDRRCAGSRSCLLLLVAASSSWVALAPRPPPAPRDASAIRQAPVSSVTAAARGLAVQAFELWVKEQMGTSFAEISRGDQATLVATVRAAGFSAYEQQWPKNRYRDLLLGIAEMYPWIRPSLSAGWRIVARWEQLEPSVPHTPLPLQMLLAALSVMIGWGWRRATLAIWLTFFALLRPGEVCMMERTDCLLPHEHDGEDLVVRIRNPKRSRGARREFSKVEACDIHPWFLCALNSLPAGAKLWPASQAALVHRLRSALGFLTSMPGIFTLGSLRAGGATALFLRWGEDLVRLQWRGRWRDSRSLPHYVQELVAAKVTSSLRGRALQKIKAVAGLLGAILDEVWRAECRCAQCPATSWCD